jgi:thiol:disulfide interchange protein DsbD
MLRKILWTVLIAVVVFSAVAAFAQKENPITWTVRPEGTLRPVKAGETFNVVLTAQISEGWHLYALTQKPDTPVIATVISIPRGQPFKLGGPIKSPPPEVAMDENFGVETEFYVGSAEFVVPVAVQPDAAPGKQKLVVNGYYQTCNDRFCLPPRTDKVEMTVEIKAGAAEPAKSGASAATTVGSNAQGNASVTSGAAAVAPPPATPAAAPSAANAASNAGTGTNPVSASRTASGGATGESIQDQSFLTFLWLAMGFGALSLLTPCVFPMIPITVSYFTKNAAEDRRAAFKKSLIYALGIILTFTALGMIIALLVGAGGLNLFAANPWVNLLITAIFIGFALNLFGAFEITIPSSILTKLDKATRATGGSDTIATLLMAFTFTLTSFTCTVPFIGTLLVLASTGKWQWPVMGMLAFSTVFALPFFLLALMPQFLSKLPKSGGWLNSVKVVMGFLEVAAAMKFISNVDLVWKWNIFTREVCLAVWGGGGFLTTFYILGKIRLTHDSPLERVSGLRLSWAIVFLAITFYMMTGLFGRQLGEIESFLPPPIEKAAQASSSPGIQMQNPGELTWILNDYQSALNKAKQERKLVFVDFTGYTCTNCRWMEANMFPRPEISKELEKYVRVRLYTDGDGELFQNQQKFQQAKYGTVALPYYAVVTGDGVSVSTFAGLTRNATEFLDFLQKSQRQSGN